MLTDMRWCDLSMVMMTSARALPVAMHANAKTRREQRMAYEIRTPAGHSPHPGQYAASCRQLEVGPPLF
jgi:hypothetical protein